MANTAWKAKLGHITTDSQNLNFPTAQMAQAEQ